MEIIFTFSGANYAIWAEQALLGENIPVKVMPLPPEIGAGCGLCLRVAPEDAQKAIGVFAGKTIPAERIFKRESENGKSRYSLYGGENAE